MGRLVHGFLGVEISAARNCVSGNVEEALPSGDVWTSIGRDDKIPCKLCNHYFILADMHNHVRKHILRAHHGEPNSSIPANLDIGLNLCR
jgi:hypothetical protein